MTPVGGRAPNIVDWRRGLTHESAELSRDYLRQLSSRLPEPLVSEDSRQKLLGLRGPARRWRGRTDPGAYQLAVRVQREAERSHCDHHGVARPDLAELLRAGRYRNVHGCNELVRIQRVPLRTEKEVVDSDNPRSPD